MRILFISNDLTTAAAVGRMLQDADLNVEIVQDAEEGFDLANLYEFDLLVADSVIEGATQLELVRRMRANSMSVPVLMLSADSNIEATVKALSTGADDVLSKPFHRDEFVARVHAIIRRSHGHATSTIAIGDLVVDTAAKSVQVAGNRVSLTGKEYEIVETMALRPGSTLTKSMFLDRLYGGMDEPEQKIIDVFMCKIRKKLKTASGGHDYIETIWGRGYCLVDPTEAVSAKAA